MCADDEIDSHRKMINKSVIMIFVVSPSGKKIKRIARLFGFLLLHALYIAINLTCVI